MKNSGKKEKLTPIEKQTAFNNWMQTKVQSIHYSNNAQMTAAYKRVQR